MTYALRKFLCLILCFITFDAMSQSIPSGIVTDSLKNPISSAVVKIYDMNNSLIDYTNTNENGKFVFRKNDAFRFPLNLVVSILGYKEYRQKLDSQIADLHIILEPAALILPDVIVREKAQIIVRQDTLVYSPRDYADKNDKSIEDVLRKMPGIIVREDGMIWFNGKQVKNVVVDGTDVMSGGYSVLTKALRHDQVKEVEIIKNFQNIIALQSKFKTNDIVINLKVKQDKFSKPHGKVEGGPGLPMNFVGESNLLLFNSRFKMVNYIGGNNTGFSYDNHFRIRSTGAPGAIGVNDLNPVADLNIPSNNLPLEQTFLNTSGGVNFNNIYVRRYSTFKLNLNGVISKDGFGVSNNTRSLISADTVIDFQETQTLENKNKSGTIAFSYELNKPRFYLFNEAKYLGKNEFSSSIVQQNPTNFKQSIDNKPFIISDNFAIVPRIQGKNVLQLSALTQYMSKPHIFQVDTGIFASVLNQSRAYSALAERFYITHLRNRASVLYDFAGTYFHHGYKLTYQKDLEHFDSEIRLLQNSGVVTSYTDDYERKFDWTRDLFTLNPNFSLYKNKLTLTLDLPVNYLISRLNYDDRLNVANNLFYLNPRLFLNRKTFNEDNLIFEYNRKLSLGEGFELNRGLIVSSFRSWFRNINNLNRVTTDDLGLTYKLQRSASFFFANFGLGYNRSVSNILKNNDYTNEGSIVSETIDDKGMNESYNFSFRISQFFYLIKLKIDFSGSTDMLESTYYINGSRKIGENTFYNVTLNAFKSVSNVVSFNFNTNYQLGNLGIDGHNSLKYHTFNNNFSVGLYITKDVLLRSNFLNISNWDSNKSKQQLYLLNSSLEVDLGSFDLAFEVKNILNTRMFVMYQYSGNQLIITNFEIRGVLALLKARYFF